MSKSLKHVVVTADDLGLHRGINQGIKEAHEYGIVTSTSLVACGDAFEDALEILDDCPNLGVGVHVTLVEERPVLLPQDITTLVNTDGRMRASYREFAVDWLLGKIRGEDVLRELKAQIERVMLAGITPDHIDGHQHVHCLPGIWRLVLEAAREFSIGFVRLPRFDDLWESSKSIGDVLMKGTVNMLSSTRARMSPKGIHYADAMAGGGVSGNMTQARLVKILSTLQNGITEVMVHPGVERDGLRKRYQHWNDFNWLGDLNAVTGEQIVGRCRDGDFVLTNFRELATKINR